MSHLSGFPIGRSFPRIESGPALRTNPRAVGEDRQPDWGNDLLIAAHVLALDAVLVTDNVREFKRVKGLRVENWLRS
ncbi:MAG TPA: hypothetical protein VGR47_19720 [Terracidiphilus sp.]|nr:hypothetical protein [Terracidiphilus sp.]